MLDPVAVFREFLIAQAATFPGDIDADGERLAENIYAVPDQDGALDGFPLGRRAIVLQSVPGGESLNGLATVSFYFRTYGDGARDAYAVARWLYSLQFEQMGDRIVQRYRIPIGSYFAKWITFSLPATTNDEDNRVIGFLNGAIRLDLYQD